MKGSDARMLEYFWQEKGDLERYCDWEELQPTLQREAPHLLKAWNDYKASRRILDAVVKDLDITDEDN